MHKKELNLKIKINLQEVDDIIRKYVPSGMGTHNTTKMDESMLKTLYCYKKLKNTDRICKSKGTLGGGNHFIELNKDSKENIYLVIHSGSRNFGKQVAEIYQDIAIEECCGHKELEKKQKEIIEKLKKEGEEKKISEQLTKIKKEFYDTHSFRGNKDLCYLTGESRKQYLHDMQLCQAYATINRKSIANIILYQLLKTSINDYDFFETIHNYINLKDNIIRKGSISARLDEKCIIPMNMRDGSLICIGKGNPDWNYSAPHGAGRIMSRNKAKELIQMKEYEESMKDVWSTSVCLSTLDESPMAYKPMEEIVKNIKDTVDIIDIIIPIYNFKAN